MDLGSLFQNLGPTGASVLAGTQAAQGILDQRSQEAFRQAQVDELRQKMAQQEQMNPLLIQQQQESNRKAALENALTDATQANKIEASGLDLQSKKRQAALDKMSTMASTLNFYAPMVAEAGPQAAAIARKALIEGGADPENPRDAQLIMSVLNTQNPQQMAANLMKLQNNLTKTSASYVQAMDTAREHSRSAENVARIGAASREAVASARSKGVQSIQDSVRSGKMTAEKAAVSLYGAAQFESDPMERQRLESMARAYEQFAMQQRQAQGQGKVDIPGATNLPAVNLPPALGSQPPVGTAANPIVLK